MTPHTLIHLSAEMELMEASQTGADGALARSHVEVDLRQDHVLVRTPSLKAMGQIVTATAPKLKHATMAIVQVIPSVLLLEKEGHYIVICTSSLDKFCFQTINNRTTFILIF
jgi:hypothetical protein